MGKLSNNYYSAANNDGSISTGRFWASSDQYAKKIARDLLGGTLPVGVTIWRHVPGNRTEYVVVEIAGK